VATWNVKTKKKVHGILLQTVSKSITESKKETHENNTGVRLEYCNNINKFVLTYNIYVSMSKVLYAVDEIRSVVSKILHLERTPQRLDIPFPLDHELSLPLLSYGPQIRRIVEICGLQSLFEILEKKGRSCVY
jgi:hypothetical protein